MRPPRLLAGVAAAAALTVAAGACDSTPVTASVNGQVIQQSTLNAELAALSANKPYIAAVDQSNAQYGVSVGGAGTGTYSSQWTAHVLTQMITADAVSQYLAAHHRLPGPEYLLDARAVEAANYQQYWTGFPASYRNVLVSRTADLAALSPPVVPASDLVASYQRYSSYFYSEVCVRTASISVDTAAGTTDYPASYQRASQLVTAMRTAPGGPAGSTVGSVTCYTPTQIESQPAAFAAAVQRLATGGVAPPERTSYGYQVVAVTFRRSLPLDDVMRRTLSAVITANSPTPTVERVLAAAHVVVDRQYGTWAAGSSGYQVTPPTPPTASAS